MSNFSEISDVIGSIKNATDIAKALKFSDASLEKAELKLKLAELIEALVDAKLQVAEIRDLFQEKDTEILRLKKMLELKAKLVRKDGVYYDKNLTRTFIAEPFCSHCWEVNNIAIHLNFTGTTSYGGNLYKCSSCKTQYQIGGWDEP